MNEAINRQLSVCFYGSSDEGLKSPLAVLHKNTVNKVVADTLELDYDSFQIITGGYGGIMDMLATEFKKQALEKSKTVQTIGITCDAYEFEDSESKNYNKSNDYSLANDVVIQAENFPARLQAMIELADIFVVLPGKQGTLSELLITSESYAYSIQMFKEKNVKILVHSYWINLLKNSFLKGLFQRSYFREIKNIHYFNSENFSKLIKDFQPSPKEYFSSQSAKVGASKVIEVIEDPIEAAFHKFCISIERAIYGRIVDVDGLRNRLKYKNGILAIDFGYYLSAKSTKTDEGEYLTYSTSTYSKLINDFFSQYNSIMFNNMIDETEIEVKYLNGKLALDEATEFKKEPIPKPSENETGHSDFETWKNFLESKQYGQTLIWRSLTHKGVNDSYKLNLSIFLLFNCHLPSRKIEKVKQLTDEYLLSVATQKIGGLFGEKEKKLQTYALQSAVAQVFARNFAHNIGSHVAIRATNRMAKERIEELYKIKKADFKNTPEIESWLDYMGEKLDLFEVARNEFLAEYKLPAKNAMLYRDVILPFCENTLLMDNIAHSEGIHYDIDGQNNKLKIKVFIKGVNEPIGKEITAAYPYLKGYKTDSEILYPDKFPFLLESREIEVEGKKIKYTIDEAFTNKLLTGKNDIEICLTNEHTLYSILENLIRNSAKHNKSSITEEEGLIISVNIEDDNDDYYRIQISDNVSKVSQERLNKFVKSIAASLITNDGEIQKESLGIADIKINAHLLKTDADITNANLSKALTLVYDKEGNEVFLPYNTEDNLSKDEKYNFGYQFKLCKPKKVVWIGQEDNPELKKKGIICLKDYTKFKPEKGDNTDNPLANYQFAILELDAVKNLTNESPNYEWDDFLIKLPHRVLLNCTKENYEKIENDTVYKWIKELKEDNRIQLVEQEILLPTKKECEKNKDWDFVFLKTCWENWLRKWVKNDEKARLIVYFEDGTIADKWSKITKVGNELDVCFLKDSIPVTSIEIMNTDKVVIYDHHSYGCEKLKNKTNIDFINKGAYLQFGKNSLDFVSFFYPRSKEEANVLFLYEAYEAGLNKVAVLDERICEMLDYNDENIRLKITKKQFFNSKQKSIADYADLANNGNVFIVTHFQGKPVYKEYRNLEVFVRNTVALKLPNELLIKPLKEASLNSCDGFIIHRTYLNRLFESKESAEKKEIMHKLYKKFKRVTIVSGGGYPHSIDFLVNFKPYSQLKSNFVQYPSKVSLMKII